MPHDFVNHLWVRSYKQSLNYNFGNPTSLEEASRIKIADSSKKWIMTGIISIQVFIMLATYNAVTTGLTTFAEFLLGVNLLIFVALYFVYSAGQKSGKGLFQLKF